MTVTVDDQQRVTLPAEPGATFELSKTDGGQFILTPVSIGPESEVQYVWKDGLLLARTERVITLEETLALLEDFPP
jgi:hypothetical protein